MKNPFFTDEELERLNNMPLHRLSPFLSDGVAAAKAELFKYIEEQTGVVPPNDYMITHKEEFGIESSAAPDHTFCNIWSWKGKRVVIQRGKMVYDGKDFHGSEKTERHNDARH